MKTLSKLRINNKLFNKDFFVFDTETTPFEIDETVEFKFGVIYGYNFTKVIESKEEFIEELLDPRYYHKKVFAHNAEFDLNVLYGNIYDMDRQAIFNNKFISATNGNCFFADSMNIYRTSVKELGKLIGLQKLDTNVVLENKTNDISEKEIEYCIRDCEIVFNALLHIFEMTGSVKITAPSLSLFYYRSVFMPYNIDYNDLVYDFFNSYFGGRTEAFKLGNTNAVVYDINSMYPFAMLNAEFPNPKFLEKKIVSIDVFLNNYLPVFEGMIKCVVIHKDIFLGCLPLRYNDKLVFPTGEFSGYWNFNEIKFAIENKIIEIKSIEYIIYSVKMKSPFTGFITDLYNLRKKSEGIEKEVLKLLMNSLYGKFAQQIKSEFIYLENIQSVESKELLFTHEINKTLIELHLFNSDRKDAFLEVKSERGEHLYNTIPLFASYITSFARVELLKYLIKYEKYKPVYCDTDSIFFEKQPPINNGVELGDWKKENKIVTQIRGLKNYSYISQDIKKDKIKGVPGKAEKMDTNKYEYASLVKTKEALVRNIKPNTYVKRTKELTGNYDKRNVFADGSTRPLKF